MRKEVSQVRKGDQIIHEGQPLKVLSRILVPGHAYLPAHFEFELEGQEGVLITSTRGWLEVPDA